MKFDFIIGIDQTGATTSQGIPKPLTCSLIDNRKKNKSKNYFELKIKSLTKNEIYNLIKIQTELNEKIIAKLKILIVVDAVLGLPSECKKSIKQVLSEAKIFEYNKKQYGVNTAYQFFNSYCDDQENPVRKVESLTKANSVFNLHPFQKNIGCGTYRILKDLAADTTWYQIWPHQLINKKTNVVMAEGYPSYYWKSWLKYNQRQDKWKNYQFKNQDSADSFIQKLSSNGSLMWVETLVGSGFDQQRVGEQLPQPQGAGRELRWHGACC